VDGARHAKRDDAGRASQAGKRSTSAGEAASTSVGVNKRGNKRKGKAATPKASAKKSKSAI
jgi:hypothetical protein